MDLKKRLVKGSPEAKEYMANIRSKRGKKGGGNNNPPASSACCVPCSDDKPTKKQKLIGKEIKSIPYTSKELVA